MNSSLVAHERLGQIATRAVLLIGTATAALMTTPARAQVAATGPAGVPQTLATQAQAGSDTNAAAAALGEIVVTARRREESLLSVPIAVTAFTADRLEKSGATDLTDIQNTTPNTTLKVARGTNSTLAAFIRGVGQQDPVPGFESGVGIYLDDVYLNRPQAAVLDVYDVDRIEVLRGPQGTLYGRNTIGGAVKYVTKRLPDEPSLDLKGTYGSYNEADGIISASAPLTSYLKAGIAAARLSHDGFGRNLNLGIDNYDKDLYALRGTLEAETSDRRLFARLTADYTDDTSDPRTGHRLIPGLVTGAPVLSNVFDTQAGLNTPRQEVKGGGGSLSINAELNDHFTLRSITAYRQDASHSPIDFDSLPEVDVDTAAVYHNKQTSQELQLLYKSERLNGLVGFYHLDAEASFALDALLYTTGGARLPGLDSYNAGDVKTDTSSVYADFTYDFTSRLSLSLGGRYTWDDRDSTIVKQNYLGGLTTEFGGAPTALGAPLTNFNGKADFHRFTPRASIDYKLFDGQLVYASYSEGFKGGGFDPRGSGSLAPISNPAVGRTYQDIYNYLLFRPERVKSYEIGWKGALFDRRLTYALDAFYADYSDVQVPGAVGAVVNGVQTFVGITTNAAKATIKGGEAESTVILARGFAGAGSNVSFSGTLGYIDANYDRFIGPTGVDVANVRDFQNTPHVTASGTLGGTLPVGDNSLSASVAVSYRSLTHQFETASPFLDQAAYALLDANLTYTFGRGGRYSIGIHGKNLTNEIYKVSGYQFINITLAGQPILNAAGRYTSTLGTDGIATAFYGNPRQVLATFTAKF